MSNDIQRKSSKEEQKQPSTDIGEGSEVEPVSKINADFAAQYIEPSPASQSGVVQSPEEQFLQMNMPLGVFAPTQPPHHIEEAQDRAKHFEDEFDAANKEVLYLQNKIEQIRKYVLIQRNKAHVNCLEEKKQAYNDVIAYFETYKPQSQDRELSSHQPANKVEEPGLSEDEIEKMAEEWTNNGKWGYPIEGDEPSQMMFRELTAAFIAGYNSKPLKSK